MRRGSWWRESHKAQDEAPSSCHPDRSQIPRLREGFGAVEGSLPLLGRYCNRLESPLKELLHLPENLHRTLRFVDRLAEPRTAGHAVRKPRRKLLHLADGIRQLFL